MIGGFVVAKNYLLEVITGKIEEMELTQTKKMPAEIQKMTETGFDFLLFQSDTYLNLKEFIEWPTVINNEGNPEPFKTIELNCSGDSCLSS